jgi:hypothetical protein
MEKLIEFLCQDWPDVVTFGTPHNGAHFLESVIPTSNRPELMASLQRSIMCLVKTDIESGQKSNAINAVKSIINNLENIAWDQSNYKKLCDFILKMDHVKNISLHEYCPETHNILQQNIC